MSVESQVASLLDVVSFILGQLTSAEAEGFNTDLLTDLYRRHLDIVYEHKRQW